MSDPRQPSEVPSRREVITEVLGELDAAMRTDERFEQAAETAAWLGYGVLRFEHRGWVVTVHASCAKAAPSCTNPRP